MAAMTQPLHPSTTPRPLADPPAARGSGLAIASVVLGILGFVTAGMLAIVGLILGIIACGKSDKHNRGIAVAGIIISGIGIVLGLLSTAFLVGMFLPALGSARSSAHFAQALNHLNMLDRQVQSYAQDHSDTLPAPDQWITLLEISPGSMLLTWPGQEHAGRAFAMNGALQNVKIDSIRSPNATVLFFECASGSPLAGGPELLAPQPRSKNGGYAVSFIDGHVEVVKPEQIPTLIWQLEP